MDNYFLAVYEFSIQELVSFELTVTSYIVAGPLKQMANYSLAVYEVITWELLDVLFVNERDLRADRLDVQKGDNVKVKYCKQSGCLL